MRATARSLWADPLARFLILSAGAYGIWHLAYELAIRPWGVLDRAVIANLMVLSGGMLRLLGFELLPEPPGDSERYIGVQGGHHLWIGDPCDGIPLFAVFTIILAAYPGPWRSKAWFLPLGLLSIHLINALRIVALSIIVTIDYELLNFNHDYTFYLVVYGWVFGLWYFWARRYGQRAAAA
jgi:exosortase/archaeosortase family protein